MRPLTIEVNDIMQITDPSHDWFGTLLIVHEVHHWGVTAYAPQPTFGNGGSRNVFIRLSNGVYEFVGRAVIALLPDDAKNGTEAHANDSPNKIIRPCPQCAEPLLVRRNRADGQEFIGCSAGPDCDYTEPMPLYLLKRAGGDPALPGFDDVNLLDYDYETA